MYPGDIVDERHIAHEMIAAGPRVAPKHLQFSLIRSEAENRVERGGLACAVGADEPEDAALFDSQIDAVYRDGCTVALAEAWCFYACHGFSAPRFQHSISMHASTMGRFGQLPAALSVLGRAVESSRESWAILLQEISGVRLAAADRVLRY